MPSERSTTTDGAKDDARSSGRSTIRFPLSRRLPLLIGLVLFVVITITTWAAYVGVKNSASDNARERLYVLTQQLANQSQQSLPILLTRTSAVANEPAIRNYLKAPSKDTQATAAASLQQFTESQEPNGLQVEIWRADHSFAFSVPGSAPLARDLDSELQQCVSDPFKFVGALRNVNGRILYTAAAAVKDDSGVVIGCLVRWRRTSPNANVRKQLSDLLGNQASLYYGNTKGDVWTDLEKPVTMPANLASTFEMTHYVRDGTAVMALGRPITGTPWSLVVEIPEQVLLSQAHRFLWRMLPVEFGLLIVGILAAGIVSSSITKPLNTLTGAASAISDGDYTPQVTFERSDELGELAAAFNSMVTKLRNSRRELEQKVRDRTAQLEAAAGAILMIDRNGIINSANENAERLLGYLPGELSGKSIETLVPDRYRAEHPGYRASFFRSPTKRPMGAGRDLSVRRKDGSEVPVEIALSPIGTDEGELVLANVVDITERRHAEERFRVLVEASPSGILMVNEQGLISLVNSQTEQLFGYGRAELLGKPLEMLVPERYRGAHPSLRISFFDHASPRAMGAGRDLYGRRKDGSEIPVEIGLRPIETNDGLLVLASIIDITERKRREEQSRLQGTALEAAANAILITDPNGKIVWVNKAFTDSSGYSGAEVIGKNPRVLNSGLQDESYYKEMWDTINACKVWRKTIVNRRKDGSLNHEDMTITPICDAAGNITQFIAIKQDITELERALSELQSKNEELATMTQQLWQASRLATVGELAASIAHELNNPLATISLRLERLAAQLSNDDQKSRAVAIVSDEVERMGKLVSNLLQFSRRNHRQISTLDVRDEVDNSFELIEYHLRSKNIQVVRDYAAELPTIQADRQQLRQVFLNLLTNASDSIIGGGRITARVRLEAQDGMKDVWIELEDTGSGIAKEDQEKIWDPFFTTKEEGKGTGLGLAICRRVIEEHRGSISLQSELGKGTIVTIRLPATNGRSVESVDMEAVAV